MPEPVAALDRGRRERAPQPREDRPQRGLRVARRPLRPDDRDQLAAVDGAIAVREQVAQQRLRLARRQPGGRVASVDLDGERAAQADPGSGLRHPRSTTARQRLCNGELVQDAMPYITSEQTHDVAQLERARAHAAVGAALRHAGRPVEARDPLRLAVDLAHRCGATELEDEALAELRAAGARPRRRLTTGAGALTPSERRIAELAAAGSAQPGDRRRRCSSRCRPSSSTSATPTASSGSRRAPSCARRWGRRTPRRLDVGARHGVPAADAAVRGPRHPARVREARRRLAPSWKAVRGGAISGAVGGPWGC